MSAQGSDTIDTRHVDVLDGIRALSIGLVFWFHLWQQSWLMPLVRLPFLARFGRNPTVSLDFIPRSGYLFVDMMLLLSAFCLFLPHARAALLNEPVPDPVRFYKKRLIRILPPYLLSVLFIFFFVALPSGAYASARAMWTDLVSTLTFTQVFVPDVLLGTKLNGVLWTVAVEMQFYLLFPLLARAFRKRPLWTYLAMVSVSMVYLRLFALREPDGLRLTLNQLPGFFGVFANGMAAAYALVFVSRYLRRSWRLSAGATAAIALLLYLLIRCQKAAPFTTPVQLWQAAYRYRLSLLFTGIVLCSALAARWYRFLLGNAAARFFAAISYNVYIWHQWLAVRFKEWRIPYWEGEQAPNFTGDAVWQQTYTWLVIAAALVVAVVCTYAFERPVAKRLTRLLDSPAKHSSGGTHALSV